jgi:hypothetical protein
VIAEISARVIATPREGSFFQQRYDTRNRDHSGMMKPAAYDVNGTTTGRILNPASAGARKKAGLKEPGLGIGHVRPTQSPSKRDY